jgi:hypothetical protein
MAIDLVDTIFQFLGRNIAKMPDLEITLDLFFKTGGEDIGVRFD